MNAIIWKTFWSLICLIATVQATSAETTNASSPHVLAITARSDDWYSRKLMTISSAGNAELAALSGAVLFGADSETAAFVQTPGSERNSRRLLIVDRKSVATIADKTLTGFTPVMMKKPTVKRLAVRSQASALFIPCVGNAFDIAEVNWKTSTVRPLPLDVDSEATHWEITALYDVPRGIAVERGPFLYLFDPAKDETMFKVNNCGTDRRPVGTYYSVPEFGLVETVKGKAVVHCVTEKDFVTAASNRENFPLLQSNIDKAHRRVAHTILGKPCLIWGENKEGVESETAISQIAIFDLADRKLLLRKSLAGNFSPYYLPDKTGNRIYFIGASGREIHCLELKSEKLRLFANCGDQSIIALVSAD